MTCAGDDSWQPIADLAAAHQRASLLRQARTFFSDRDVLEIDTPVLGDATVSDPGIESIAASLASDPAQTFFLQTSPEYHMKRLLAAGFPDIYQISKVFRDAELGSNHQPEFTMVEWYRLGFELEAMIQETLDFVSVLVGPSRITAVADRISYADACKNLAGIDPSTAGVAELDQRLQIDADLSRSLGDSVDARLDLLMATRIAPQFNTHQLTVVYHYPASQAALARICPVDDTVADRFEIFYGPLELANGYVELTDAREQHRRLQADQATRRSNNAPIRPVDTKFLDALESGLPACAGVAVGFDRLLMVHTGSVDIRKTRHFPIGI